MFDPTRKRRRYDEVFKREVCLNDDEAKQWDEGKCDFPHLSQARMKVEKVYTSNPKPALPSPIPIPVEPIKSKDEPVITTGKQTSTARVKAWQARNKDKHNSQHRAYMQRWRAKRKQAGGVV